MSIVGVNVGTHCAKELGEACCEVRALGVDGLYVNRLSDLCQHFVENPPYALIEMTICRCAFEDGPGS